MKSLTLAFAVLTLNSCNTSIGFYRDTKVAYHWTKDKVQGSGHSGTESDSTTTHDEGAPVY